MTFFDWSMAAPRRIGPGTVAETAFRVAGSEALQWWKQRFAERDIAHQEEQGRTGRASLAFTDPEGQRLRLVDDEGKAGGTPWSGSPVPQEFGIRGLDAVTLEVARLDPTARVLTSLLGFRLRSHFENSQGQPVAVYETGQGGAGTEVHLIQSGGFRGTVGSGGVHHVAFRTANVTEQEKWHQHLTEAGLAVSPIIDRYYFHSIYFREPGGILFEIATDGPGFAADEDPDHLGERLALPPFLEPQRARIEAGLKPV
jgi:glyoxalase family protein